MNTGGVGPAVKCKGEKELAFFKKNDIVWAKVRGYSWWPAKVSVYHLSKFRKFIQIGLDRRSDKIER